MLNSKEIAQIKKLKEDGYSLKDIEEKTSFSIPTIIKYAKGIKKKRKRPPRLLPSPESQSQEETEQNPRLPKDPPEDSVPTVPTEPNLESLVEAREALVEVKGVPVGKKILLTPKNLTMMQWFQARYNWEGDISDFVNQCMEFFFKEGLHAKMKVEIEEEFA